MRIGFLIAGVQKCGTTALWQFLRQHPDIYLPESKELHFFDGENGISWNYNSDYTDYHRHFDDAGTDELLGESTPSYTYWRPSAARIHGYNQKIKLIILLRDPVARAYSHWRMVFERNVETLCFSEAIREGRQRMINEAGIAMQLRPFSYVERGFYAEQIKRLLSYFPREQLLFLTTSGLFNHHEETLDRVCTFLDVPCFNRYPHHETVFSHKDNNVAAPDQHDVDYLRVLFHDDLEEAHDFIGLKIELEI